MNESTLDRVARALATGQSRRGVMKAAAAAATGGALTMVGRHEDAAAGKRRLRRCCRRKKREAIQICAESGRTLVSFFCAKASTGPDFCGSDGDCG